MPNSLYYGDNLHVMRDHIASETADLIYLDPPFNSQRNYLLLFKDRTGHISEAQQGAFTDTWTWGEEAERTYRELQQECSNHDLSVTVEALRRILRETPMMAYLVSMAVRLVEMHRILKPTGSLYLHCDPTASHYLKVLLDVIFGPEHFRNEITWKRQSAHSDAKHKWADLTDSILYYAKSRATKFTPQYTAHSDAYVDGFYRYDDEDGRGMYQLGDMASPNPRPNLMYLWNGFPHPGKGWRYSKETMQKLDEEGRINYPRHKDGSFDLSRRPRLKRYLNEQQGTIVGNIWNDIPPVQAKGESLGYPTQKPLALLERIIEASSKPGDVVMDPYCGCGTAVAAAQKLGRQWIGIDITSLSVSIIKTRLEQAFPELKGKVPVVGFPVDLEGARALFEADPYKFQNWANTLIDAYPLEKKGADNGIDGWRNFLDLDGMVHRAVVQVKGGKVSVGQIRDFCHVVAREKATLGFFLCMGDDQRSVTKPMTTEALKEGYWESVGRHCYGKVQILSVAGLLDHSVEPHLPPQDKRSSLGFTAKRQVKKGEQLTNESALFD